MDLRRPCKADTPGSIPGRGSKVDVAQMVERRCEEPEAVGSIPTVHTKAASSVGESIVLIRRRSLVRSQCGLR